MLSVKILFMLYLISKNQYGFDIASSEEQTHITTNDPYSPSGEHLIQAWVRLHCIVDDFIGKQRSH